jgi:hypothetical protein
VRAIDAPTHAVSASEPARARSLRLDPKRWRVIERESGPVDYYRVVDDPKQPFIRAEYRPPLATTVLGYELDEATRKRASRVSWKWRAITLPEGGDECQEGKGDSAAVLYVTWKRGLRYYTLKYVWTTESPRGAVCDRKRNPLVAQDTVVVEAGPPLSIWRSESVDLKAEFRRHFAEGDAHAEVPEFIGIGIMTDGDQTHSPSAADYADFVLELEP